MNPTTTHDDQFTVNLSNGSTAKIVKRTRKPWVYKTKYDRLERHYVIAKWLAFAGWLAFILTISMILLQV